MVTDDMIKDLFDGKDVLCPYCNSGYFRHYGALAEATTFYCENCKKQIIFN